MPAIKATNSRGLKVINCRFSGFEIDIELNNVEDFLSQNNVFSRQNNPQFLMNELIRSIDRSNLSTAKKKQLFSEIIDLLSKGKSIEEPEKKKLISKIGNYVGDKAVDFFVQLVAAVLAGLVVQRQ